MAEFHRLAQEARFVYNPPMQVQYRYDELKRVAPISAESQAGGSKKKKTEPTSKPKETETEKKKQILVAENDELALYVKLVGLKRMTRFNVQDLLYHFEIEKKVPDENVTLTGFAQVLEKGLGKAVSLIQELYEGSKEDYVQMFVVFQDYGKSKKGEGKNSEPLFTFNSGHYLLWQEASKISASIWAKLSTYFQSNKNFEIDQGFYFSITVVHSSHASARQKNPVRYKAPLSVGGNADSSSSGDEWSDYSESSESESDDESLRRSESSDDETEGEESVSEKSENEESSDDPDWNSGDTDNNQKGQHEKRVLRPRNTSPRRSVNNPRNEEMSESYISSDDAEISSEQEEEEEEMSPLLKNFNLNVASSNYFEVPKSISKRKWCLPATLLYAKARVQKNLFDKLERKLKKMGTLSTREQKQYNDLLTCPYKTLFRKLNKFNGARQSYSSKILMHETKKLLVSLNLQERKSFDVYTDGTQIADYLQVQFYLYDKMGKKKIYEYPEKRDLSRPSVLLFYESSKNGSIGHVGLILAKSFFNGHFQCPFCDKNVGYRQTSHYCENTCFACKGFKISPDQSVHLSNEGERGFCETENSESQAKQAYASCIKCQVYCFSLSCLKKHQKSSACQAGFYCQNCRRYQRKSKTVKTRKEFMAQHNCDEYVCRLCYETYNINDPESHLCRVKNVASQEGYPNLAFFDIETLAPESNPDNCEECILREIRYVTKHKLTAANRYELDKQVEENGHCLSRLRCPQHKKKERSRKYHEVNALSVYFEENKRGQFARAGFFDPHLNLPQDCEVEKNVYSENYFLPSMEKVTEIDRRVLRQKGQFRGKTSEENDDCDSIRGEDDESTDREEQVDYGLNNWESLDAPVIEKIQRKQGTYRRTKDELPFEENLEKVKKLAVVEKFLLFILREQFRNYTFFSFNGQAFDHQYIVEAAYNLGLCPEIICRGQKILSLSFARFNIRFLDFMLYKSGSLSCLAKQAKIKEEKLDFPFKFNQRKNYDYEGPIPENSNFEKSLESKEQRRVRNVKLNSARKKDTVWNFKTEISKYVHLDVLLLLKLAIRFLKECFQFQELCSTLYPDTNRKMSPQAPYLHPYGNPFCTLSGYVYGSWKHFCLEEANLFIVHDEKGEKTINTSQKEHEWIAFVQHELGKDTRVESAFTSPRPPTFGNIRPDFYIEKSSTVGEFKGCRVHGNVASCQNKLRVYISIYCFYRTFRCSGIPM